MIKRTIGFKIAVTIGIIILFLGFTVLFSVYPMLKNLNEISGLDQQMSLNKIFSEISDTNAKQSMAFELIRSNKEIVNSQSIDMFWKYSNEITAQIKISKLLAEQGYLNSENPDIEFQFENIHNKISIIEKNHNDLQNMVSDVLILYENKNYVEAETFTSQIQEKTELIDFEISESVTISSFIADLLVEQSNLRTYESINNQVIIIILVGAVSIFLGYFINQINSELQQKVEEKTLELKKANDKLQELDSQKDEFINIASHELKSPIQPIIGFAELAREGNIDQKLAWDGVTDLATKLQDLANTILDVGKIERSTLVLDKEKFSINDLINDAVKTVSNDPNKKVPIKMRLDEDARINLDRVRMGQVLRNILSNAIKYTHEGEIIVRSYKNLEKNQIKIIISDTGSGISGEVLPKIFEKFVTKNNKKSISGTGLGMFLSKGIVDAHGGEIIAYNTKRGASFEITMKLNEKKVLNCHSN